MRLKNDLDLHVAVGFLVIAVFGVYFLASCFRVPVRVVQYAEEQPVVVAPVGEVVQVSASRAVMNPRVMDPEKVGPLPPKPEPIGFDWGSLLAVGLGLIPGIGGTLAVVVPRLLKSSTAVRELVGSVQAVKERYPEECEKINEVLISKQSAPTRSLVAKHKGKTK